MTYDRENLWPQGVHTVTDSRITIDPMICHGPLYSRPALSGFKHIGTSGFRHEPARDSGWLWRSWDRRYWCMSWICSPIIQSEKYCENGTLNWLIDAQLPRKPGWWASPEITNNHPLGSNNHQRFDKANYSSAGKVGAVDVLRTYLLIDVSAGDQKTESIWLGLLMSFGHTY